MPRLRDLQETRSSVVAQMRTIADLDEPTAEQTTEFGALRGQLTNLEAQIDRLSLVAEAERRSAGTRVDGGRSADSRLPASIQRTILLAMGADGDHGQAREVHQEMERRGCRASHGGYLVPLSVFEVERRVVTTALPAGGPGGNLIATDLLAGQFIDILRSRLITAQLGARVLTGLVGNVAIPRLKNSVTAYWFAENTEITPSDIGIDQIGLAPNHVGALTEYTRNLLLQSTPDIETIIRDDMAAVLARAVDAAAINGGGGVEPQGIIGTAGVGTASLATATWDDVLGMVAAIETANGGGTGWVGRPETAAALQGTLKVTGDGAAGFIMTDPRSLAGYPFVSSTIVPNDLGAGNNDTALVFGDWSDLVVGYWGALEILANPYSSPAYEKGNVKVRAILTCDTALRHPESFVAATDL